MCKSCAVPFPQPNDHKQYCEPRSADALDENHLCAMAKCQYVIRTTDEVFVHAENEIGTGRLMKQIKIFQ